MTELMVAAMKIKPKVIIQDSSLVVLVVFERFDKT